jgi:hypothetical protein
LFRESVDEAQRTRDRFERLLDGGQMRRLLLQETQRSPSCIERGGRVLDSGGSPGFFDLEESSHRVGDWLGNAH